MRIAICDDLQTERQKTIEALDSVIRNFSVNEFDDGAELIKSHEVLPYDLIILDILMPKISVMDTAAQADRYRTTAGMYEKAVITADQKTLYYSDLFRNRNKDPVV